MIVRALLLSAFFLASAWAQNVQRPGPVVGCPMRDVKAVILKISPQGDLVLDVKGDIMAARLTDQTRYVIPGYDRKTVHKGLVLKLPAKSQARLRICLTNGEVEQFKLLTKPKKALE